jgi:hypothetical protein
MYTDSDAIRAAMACTWLEQTQQKQVQSILRKPASIHGHFGRVLQRARLVGATITHPVESLFGSVLNSLCHPVQTV